MVDIKSHSQQRAEFERIERLEFYLCVALMAFAVGVIAFAITRGPNVVEYEKEGGATEAITR